VLTQNGYPRPRFHPRQVVARYQPRHRRHGGSPAAHWPISTLGSGAPTRQV